MGKPLDELEQLKEALQKERKRAVNAEYMAHAYRNMLGEKGAAVAARWDAKGVTRVHFDWGPDARNLTGEERAEFILQWEDSPHQEVDFIDNDEVPAAALAEYRGIE